MSHTHRDDQQLVEPGSTEPEPVAPVAPPQAVTNSEATRRAEERRRAEGITDLPATRAFSEDLPRPGRGGGDTEVRVIVGVGDTDDETTRADAFVTVRRGPPPPRFGQHEAAGTWASPRSRENARGMLGGTLARWDRPIARDRCSIPSAASWARRSRTAGDL